MTAEPEDKKSEDHDLLIRIDTQLSGLCSQVLVVKKENREDHKSISKSLDAKVETKLPAKFFYWLMPFIILSILGIASLASDTHYGLGRTDRTLELHLKQDPMVQETEKETVKDAVTQSIIVQE